MKKVLTALGLSLHLAPIVFVQDLLEPGRIGTLAQPNPYVVGK
jgi:hypothetical protein